MLPVPQYSFLSIRRVYAGLLVRTHGQTYKFGVARGTIPWLDETRRFAGYPGFELRHSKRFPDRRHHKDV